MSPPTELQEIPVAIREQSGFFASTRDECLSPRVRLECNPEIPVAPAEEHWLLDTSLDETSPALAGGFLTTEPPGKPNTLYLTSILFLITLLFFS